MKTKNKYLAIISALMLCIVLFSGLYPVKVSAAESNSLSDLHEFYLTGGTGDWEGVKREYVKKKDFVNEKKSNYPEYSAYIYPVSHGGDDDNYMILTYDLSSEISRFKLGFGILRSVAQGRKFPYYIYFCGIDNDPYVIKDQKIPLLVIQTFASMSPIRYELKDGKYCLASDSDIVYATTSFPTSGLTDTFREGRLNELSWQTGSNSIFTDTRFNFDAFNYPADVTDVKNGKYFYFSGSNSPRSITWQEIYTNCDIEINGQNLKNELFNSLKDQIDVKLTPEFGLDMDRVFDKNTGQNDYFKFEVTNNSNTNIQFCASIIDEKGNLGDTLDKALSGTIFEGVFTFDYTEWEEGYWNYITDGQHYVDCYEETKKLLVLKKYRRYAELQKGNFYWVLLKPGDHFEDFIYWENIKINPKTKYSFVVDCIPTCLDYSTDIFYALNGEHKIFSHPDEIKDIDDYEKDSTLERYALNYEECECVYNQVFSVTSIPDFKTTVRGGNAKITSGWDDTFAQSNNPYYREDLSNGEIIPVENYSEFKGSLGDVNIDISNIKFEDIGTYITYSTNFFNLIKNVLVVFPGWIWVLICFGLTALIVIAIVKALL